MKKIIISGAVILAFLLFFAHASGAAERVALMLEGADHNALPLSFNGQCYGGLEKARERFGKRIQTKAYNSFGDAALLEPLLRSASQESNLVIITSVRYVPALKKIHAEFPNCRYLLFDCDGVPDVTTIRFREDEGGFLAGALAAIATSDKSMNRINDALKIGIIIGEKAPPTERFLLGYRAGARYVSPKVEVLCEYTGNFVDSSKAEAAARRLRSAGADVIFCAAGPASLGAIKNAEARGYWCIGVDSELEREFPRAVLASVVKRSGHVITRVVENYMNGTLTEGSFPLGLESGCIDISTWTREAKTNIPVDVRERVDAIAEKIRKGLLVIEGKDYSAVKAK